jgi:cell division protein FtsL
MELWTAIGIIVIIGSISGVIKSVFEHRGISQSSKNEIQKLEKQIEKNKTRITNLESIIFELEKESSA